MLAIRSVGVGEKCGADELPDKGEEQFGLWGGMEIDKCGKIEMWETRGKGKDSGREKSKRYERKEELGDQLLRHLIVRKRGKGEV